MRVAAIQFQPEFQDKVANLKRLSSLVQEASTHGAELVVMPELATTGYSFMGRADADLVAESLADPTSLTLRVMTSLSQRFGVHLVWGMVERHGSDLYNSQVFLSPEGDRASYRKVNRWANDFLWAEPGRENPPIIDVPALQSRVGLLICRDVRDKVDEDWTSLYSKGDADVVCLSANWGDGGFPSVSWMNFVKGNDTALVVSNRYGQESCNNFGEGGVCVISRFGEVQCEGLLWSQDCIVYGSV